MRKIFALFLCLSLSSTFAEEISFFDDDGGFFTLTITGGCYTFQPKLVRKATSSEIENGCFYLFKQPNCEGTQITVRKGSHNLKELGFDKSVNSVSLCEENRGTPGVVVPRPIPVASSNSPPTHSREMQNQNEHTQQEVWDVAVEEHNKYRRLHGVPDVKGNKIMHEDAQKWSDHLVATDRFEPTTMGKYGNNIASSFRRDKLDALRDAIKRWYNKGEGSTKGIINADTTDIGIGITWNDREKEWVINAFYSPPVLRSNTPRGYFMPPSQSA